MRQRDIDRMKREDAAVSRKAYERYVKQITEGMAARQEMITQMYKIVNSTPATSPPVTFAATWVELPLDDGDGFYRIGH